jgi:hypothetical protein
VKLAIIGIFLSGDPPISPDKLVCVNLSREIGVTQDQCGGSGVVLLLVRLLLLPRAATGGAISGAHESSALNIYLAVLMAIIE